MSGNSQPKRIKAPSIRPVPSAVAGAAVETTAEVNSSTLELLTTQPQTAKTKSQDTECPYRGGASEATGGHTDLEWK